MTKAEYPFLSPGILFVLWRLLYLVKEYGENGLSIQAAANLLLDVGMFGGTIPLKQGIKLGQRFGFLMISSGTLFLTDLSRDKIVPLCDDEEPNLAVMRALLFQIVSLNPYHWLLFFCEDGDEFRTAIPRDWIDLLDSAALFLFEEHDVTIWWRALLEKFHSYDESRRKEIGDIGEKLTVEHERQRLLDDGVQNSHVYVKWVSRFSDSFGYDVLSIRGQLLKAQHKPKDEIQIEVKSSVVSNTRRFRFRVTKNEWNTALTRIDSYFFFCWTGISLETETAAQGPFILPAKSLINHFPVDRSDVCEWTECRMTLDLSQCQ